MKKLSKLGLILLALVLPLVTSANEVGVDKPHEENKGKQECTQAVIRDTIITMDNVMTSDGPGVLICATQVTVIVQDDCATTQTATPMGCEIF
jgi:hypothetical protein